MVWLFFSLSIQTKGPLNADNYFCVWGIQSYKIYRWLQIISKYKKRWYAVDKFSLLGHHYLFEYWMDRNPFNIQTHIQCSKIKDAILVKFFYDSWHTRLTLELHFLVYTGANFPVPVCGLPKAGEWELSAHWQYEKLHVHSNNNTV